jgi:hypothetical protein
MTGLFCPLSVRWLQSIEPSPPTTTPQIPSTWIGILAEVSDYLEAYKLARQFVDADEKPLLLESDDASGLNKVSKVAEFLPNAPSELDDCFCPYMEAPYVDTRENHHNMNAWRRSRQVKLRKQ